MTYQSYVVFSMLVPGLFCGQALKYIGNLSPFCSKTFLYTIEQELIFKGHLLLCVNKAPCYNSLMACDRVN